MIRKAIIVVLTLGAVATSALNWRSYSNTIRREFRLTSKVVLFVHFSDGFSRLFWWSCEEDFVIEIRRVSSWNNENVIFPRTLSWCYYPAWALTTAEKIRETGMSSYQFLSETIRPTSGPGNPSLYHGFIRTRTWTVFTIFAAYPAIASFRGPLRRWRRRRKGLCLKCGYDLTGNESGVCPECGSPALDK